MRLRRWHLVACVVGGVLTTLACQWALGTASERYGPFDRYLVEAVIRNSNKETFAAVVKYHHGNSSADVHAIWLGEGRSPEPGSATPLVGWPALVSVSPIPVEQITFAPGGNLIVAVHGPVEVSSGTKHCYFDDIEASAICLDGSLIRLKVSQ